MFPNSLLAQWDAPVWYPTRFDSPMNIMRGVAFWLTIALALGVVVAALCVKGDARKKLLKIALMCAIFYAVALGIAFLVMTFLDDGIDALLFVPLLIVLVCSAGCLALLLLRRDLIAKISAGVVMGAAAIGLVVCLAVRYASGVSLDLNGIPQEDVQEVGLYISAAVLVVGLIAAAFLLDFGNKQDLGSKSLAYAAVMLAMSFALSYIRLVKLPQGGSVTVASLLPLMIYSYMFGTRKGVMAGAVYGILQAIQDLYILHPAQFLLDYPVAFACIGLAGMFAKTKALKKVPQLQFALGAIVACTLRYVSHVLSGVFAFSTIAASYGMGAWPYSLLYNSFVFADCAIAVAVGIFVFCSPSFVKLARRFHGEKKTTSPDQSPEQA